MKKFMVSVYQETIDPAEKEKMQPEENKIVGGWREKGIMLSMFFRADDKGLFGIMQAESSDAIIY